MSVYGKMRFFKGQERVGDGRTIGSACRIEAIVSRRLAVTACCSVSVCRDKAGFSI